MYSAQRLKKRYIVFRVSSASKFSEDEMKRELIRFLLRFFGEYGFSKLSFKLLQYAPGEQLCLVRCNRKYLEDMLGSLALINSLGEKKARTVALASSGTIQTLREKGFSFIKEKEEKKRKI